MLILRYYKISFRHYKTPLAEYCHRRFRGRDPALPLVCSACKKQIKIYSVKVTCVEFLYNQIIKHANVHLKKILYTCRHCDYGAQTTVAIRKHLIECHEMKSWGQYNDLTINYQTEISAMISQCFDANLENDK